MKLSKTQKGKIRESFLAYAAAIPVESEADFKKVQEILTAITQDQYDSIDIPKKMQKAADKLNDYVKLFIEMNPNYSDRESYFRDLKKEINRNIDRIIQNEQIDVYTFGQEINSPEQANNIPIVQILSDISNLSNERIEILNKFLRTSNTQRLSLFDDDVLEEYIASSHPTRSPTLFGYARTSQVLQPKTVNEREENLKLLKSLASSPKTRQFLLDESIRLNDFLALGKMAKDFALILSLENNFGLLLYQLNILREERFREWSYEGTTYFVKTLAGFADQGLLAEKKPSRNFLLSLNPDQLYQVKTLLDKKTISVDELAKVSKFKDIGKIRRDLQSPFTLLPVALQHEIAQHLGIKDIAKLRQASKKTKKVMDKLIISPGNIATLIHKLNDTQLNKFIRVYWLYPSFHENLKKAFEKDPKLTLIFFMKSAIQTYSFISIGGAKNLFDTQYTHIHARWKANQRELDDEYKKNLQVYQERKAKYDEEEKKYQIVFDEYKALAQAYRDNNKKGEAPIKPQRKIIAPSLPTREKIKLSGKEAMQIACYALTTDDVKKLDIVLLKLAIERLPKDAPKNLKPSLEKMLELISEGKIDSLQNISTATQEEFLLVNVSGLDRFKGADLTNSNLSGRNLISLNLENANLQDSNLTRCLAFHANLHNANLMKTDLRNTNLDYADLSGANLRKAKLENTSLRGVRINNQTNFSGAEFFSSIPSSLELDNLLKQNNKQIPDPRIRLAMAQNIFSLMQEELATYTSHLKHLLYKLETQSNDVQSHKFNQIFEIMPKMEQMRESFLAIKRHPYVSFDKSNALRFYEDPIRKAYEELEYQINHAFHYAEDIRHRLEQGTHMKYK